MNRALSLVQLKLVVKRRGEFGWMKKEKKKEPRGVVEK